MQNRCAKCERKILEMFCFWKIDNNLPYLFGSPINSFTHQCQLIFFISTILCFIIKLMRVSSSWNKFSPLSLIGAFLHLWSLTKMPRLSLILPPDDCPPSFYPHRSVDWPNSHGAIFWMRSTFLIQKLCAFQIRFTINSHGV